MDNDLISKPSFWQRNKRVILAITLVMIVLSLLFLSKVSGLSGIAQTYSDSSLYQNAIQLANRNSEVLSNVGTIKPIDKLAILEGNSVYTNENNTAEVTLRVKGEKENAKIDIVANKSKTGWQYEKIVLRIKETGKTITVVH